MKDFFSNSSFVITNTLAGASAIFCSYPAALTTFISSSTVILLSDKDVFEVFAVLLISSAASGNAREAKIATEAIHPPPPRNVGWVTLLVQLHLFAVYCGKKI
ncbi:MAG: hypothetical protein LBG21_07005 [Campylobacteraceae bacterium]|nr:hypothetical protein [Campylobacteraceae bacterium]